MQVDPTIVSHPAGKLAVSAGGRREAAADMVAGMSLGLEQASAVAPVSARQPAGCRTADWECRRSSAAAADLACAACAEVLDSS